MTTDQTETLKQAISKYGTTQQLDMVIEECSELIQAINKVKRAGIVAYNITKPNKGMDSATALKYHNLCSEVADVKIMIAQMELMLDKETIDICVDRKIERLKNRIKN